MTHEAANHRLDRPVDEARDHVLGAAGAEITLVEYGSYACPYCRAANEGIAEIRQRFGDRLRYVFRHRPVTGSELARRAAELVEHAPDPERFWKAHHVLMERSETLTEEDLRAAAADLGLERSDPAQAEDAARRAKERVDADVASARASGAFVTPTFFVNGRRYEGLWEQSALADAMLDSLGRRVRVAALDFARWAPSAGVLLFLATLLAVALTNSPLGPGFRAFWETPFGLSFGGASLRMPLLRWVDEGLLTVFFLVVGLEIKREFTVGHLASRRSAALPVAAALGGMAGPVLLYRLVLPEGPWAQGWGVPMATDTAFAVAVIAMLGRRVPVELRIFLTATTIADDLGAIGVVALFYSEELHGAPLAAAGLLAAALALLARLGVYRVLPYLALGVALWAALLAGGIHATLAGVILALAIPTREPANLRALMAQADAILGAEARRSSDVLRRGPSAPAMQALDAIHDRLESPADRMLRTVSLRSSYLVLPIFALANGGVVLGTDALRGRDPLLLAIGVGLVLGKPLGMLLASALAVQLRIATKPSEYSWAQLGGAGALSGIGFTMSLFIAGEAFPVAADFAAAKIAVFAASGIAAALGAAVLHAAGRGEPANEERAIGAPAR
jgi:NhaA family Na+:H+ antiporter